jgi:hypothetical protein
MGGANMNDLNDVKNIVDEHFSKVGQWLMLQQPKCKTVEDADAVFVSAQKRAEQGLEKLKELKVSADLQDHVNIVSSLFERQIAVYNFGAKRNYKQSVKLAKRVEKLAFAYERMMKGNGG